MNLFQAYLIKYACNDLAEVESSDPCDLLQELDNILANAEKPELEHAAPVADKAVEVTVIKLSDTKQQLVAGLINYGLKLTPEPLSIFDPATLAAASPAVIPSTYFDDVPAKEDSKSKQQEPIYVDSSITTLPIDALA